MDAKLNVVIADDDGVTRSVLRLLLTENFHAVVGEASDGMRAIEICAQLKPDIAFLDIDMPRKSGHEAAVEILRDNPKVRVVMVSGLATMENVQNAMNSGASGFVVKPFNAQKIIEVIARVRKQKV